MHDGTAMRGFQKILETKLTIGSRTVRMDSTECVSSDCWAIWNPGSRLAREAAAERISFRG